MNRRAIILAGGKGTRLKPYTDTIPKPLVPIAHETPILAVIIRQLAKQGFERVTLAVNHGADLIISHFGDGSAFGIPIDYVRETEPLHTIGPLTLVPDLPDHFLVLNGDTLTDLDYAAFLDEHRARGNDISVSAKARDVKIDFGVLSFDSESGALTSFEEKPTHQSYVAMGVNCFSRSVIESLPRGKWYGFDDLLHDSLMQGRKVWVRPHAGFWIDIGRPEDYRWVVEHYDEISPLLWTKS